MNKMILSIGVLFLSSLNAQVDLISSQTIGNEKDYFVEKICIDSYVYINMYQKKPVMTIQYGTQTALTHYSVLQGIVQSTVEGKYGLSSTPERCKNKKAQKATKK
jgi:hypothetical protein